MSGLLSNRRGRAQAAAPWVAAGIGVITVAGFALLLANIPLIYGNDEFLWGLFTAASIAYVVAGLAIIRRSSSPLIGWLCFLVAFALELGLTLSHYAIYAIGVHPGSLPAPGLMLAIAQTTPFLTLTGIILILHLFPTGKPAGRLWRWFLAATVFSQAGAMLITLFLPGRITDVWSDELSHAGVSATNPLGIGFVHSIAVIRPVLGAVYAVAGIGAVVSLFARRKRSTPEERQQIRWLATLAGIAAVWIVVMLPIASATDPNGPVGAIFWLVITPLVALGPPAAIGIAIMKYRLYDIDVVIRKTVVFGLLAASITAVYVAIVVGLGSLLANTLALRLAATAVVAVAFQPARQWADRLANRLVYGRRATPYEVLARFAERMGDTYASEDVVVRIARVIAEGTGAKEADVWLRLGSEFHDAGSWPSDGSREPVPAPVDGSLPQIEADKLVPVRHRGELLGMVSVTKPPGEPFKANEAELLERLADQSGLVLANVRMTADLEARLDQISRQAAELRASRQRIVAAQDEERRRLERNIHDGAQQHLVALAVRLKLVRGLMGTDPERGRAMLADVRTQVDAALDTLRALSLGIYPPLLEEQGIAAALAAQYISSDLPVKMRTEGLRRHPVEIEAAVYFCVLEALQNAAKYARASQIVVTLREEGDSIRFEVDDDGIGFQKATGGGTGLAGMRDRLAVFGGDAEIESEPGRGTAVRGRIPLSEAIPA